MMRSCAGLCCLLLLFIFSDGQPILLRFDNFDARDGLADNVCKDIFQDSRGFVWIATETSLNRYDGISFQNFFHLPSDSNSISGNIVNTMTELPGGLLVLGTNDGLSVYNIYQNRFENSRIKHSELSGGHNISIRKVFCDADHNLWVSHHGVLDIFDSCLNYKSRFTDSPQGKIINGIKIDFNNPILDSGNNLWIPSDNMGIVLVEHATRKVTCYKNSKDSLFVGQPIRGLWLDSLNQVVWFSPWGYGLWKYDLSHKVLTQYTFPAPDPSFFHAYNTFNGIVPAGGKLLCGSETGGLFEFNPADGKFKIHSHDIYDARSILSDEINKMLTDREHNLWVATYKGLAKSTLLPTPFRSFSNEFRKESHGPYPQLFSFAPVDTTWLIAGTESQGLFALNRQTGEVKHCINHRPGHENENVIARLYVDRDQTIWVGTFDGFFIYNPKKNILTNPTGTFAGLPREEVTTLYEDSRGDYWFGFRRKIILAHYSSRENKIVNYYAEETGNPADKIFPKSYISKIREDKDGHVWFSTVGEQWFIRWNPSDNSLANYPNTKFKEAKFTEWISDLLPDTGNAVWLTSLFGRGLRRYHYDTGNMESYSREEGLCSEIVKSLAADSKGNIWLGTQNGLSVFNPHEKKFKNFDVTDGLPDNEFIRSSVFDSASHLVYLLTAHSIVYFNPDDLTEKASPPNLYIQKIQINGKDTAVDLSQRLVLNYDQNYLNIEYTSVNFKDGSKTRFFYTLSGLDNKWNEAGSKRFASYSNLAPGAYSFKLRANSGNSGSSEIQAIHFVVLPPFWKTWWFRLIIFLFILACIYWIVVRRVRLIRKEEKQKTEFNRQLAETEMKALRAQMNPHFIFNCLNSINKFILENDSDNASLYLSKFSNLIRMILENSEHPMISVGNELDMLEAYLEMESHRFKTRFEYEIVVSDGINKNDTEIPSMLIQPYVENSIWHGLLPKNGKGILKICISKVESPGGDSLKCTIADNGIGRTRAHELKRNEFQDQKSMGMKVTDERIHLISISRNRKPEIKITDLYDDKTPSGTLVELTIPIG